MSVKIFYLVHSTTTDNEHDLATGWNPGKLSELGIEQANDVHKKLRDQHFDAVFCSDLHRAIQSTEIFFGNNLLVESEQII